MFILKLVLSAGIGLLLYSEMSCYARLLREDRQIRGEPYGRGDRIFDWCIICFIVYLAVLGVEPLMAQF